MRCSEASSTAAGRDCSVGIDAVTRARCGLPPRLFFRTKFDGVERRARRDEQGALVWAAKRQAQRALRQRDPADFAPVRLKNENVPRRNVDPASGVLCDVGIADFGEQAWIFQPAAPFLD